MVQVICIVSPIWRVMAVKLAAARSTLLAEPLATWLTRQLCWTVVAAVASVKMFTTVEDDGEPFAAGMSVTVPAAATNPLVVSSVPDPMFVPPSAPQSPLVVAAVTPVEPYPGCPAGLVAEFDMAMKWKLQEADTAQKPSLLEVTNFSTYIALALKITLWTCWH